MPKPSEEDLLRMRGAVLKTALSGNIKGAKGLKAIYDLVTETDDDESNEDETSSGR